MDEYGVVSEANTVRIERVLPAAIDQVWAYLTEPDKRGTWMASGIMNLQVGGEVKLEFDFSKYSSEAVPEHFKEVASGHVQAGHVTQYNPPSLLAFTWGENHGSKSEVTFELAPQGKNTLLVLTHRRLAHRNAMVNVASGWHGHLGILEDRLGNRQPRPFWSGHAQLKQEYEKRIASALPA